MQKFGNNQSKDDESSDLGLMNEEEKPSFATAKYKSIVPQLKMLEK